MASFRVSANIERVTSSALTGANPKPQFPSVTEVTPCQPSIVQ
jgi:hypothetical protein